MMPPLFCQLCYNASAMKKAKTTREKILIAARRLFVQHGFSGTSISMIAQEAKINQSLIYHHFSNKENLWQVIKMEPIAQFQELKGLDIPHILAIEDPAFFIEQLVTFRFELYERNPDLRRIIDWQFLETPSSHLQGFRKETLQQMVQAIEQFQAKHVLTKKYDARAILISLLDGPLSFFKGMTTLSITLPKESLANSAAKQKKIRDDFLALYLNSLKKELLI